MVQVNEISTKTIKELANAVNGKWDAKSDKRCRYAVAGHVAFVECVGEPADYDLPVKPFANWYALASNSSGWTLYMAIIQ